MATSCGLMVPSTKGTGVTIKPTDTENLYMPTGMCMRENGLMTKLTVRERTLMQTAHTTTATGWTTSSTAGAWSLGLTAPSMRDNTVTAKKMGEASSPSLMEVSTMESSKRMKSAGMGSTTGQMVNSTRASGSVTRCMVMAC